MFGGRREYDPQGLSIADLMLRDDLDEEPLEAFESLLLTVKEERSPDKIVLVSQRIIELHPTHRAALASLARAKIDLGSPTDAEASICNALLGAPDSVSLRQLLAELYEASGKRDAADRVRREICDAQRWRGGDPPTSLILPGEEPPSCPSLTLDLPLVLDPARELSPDLLDEPDTPPSLILEVLADTDTAPSLILTDEVTDSKAKSRPR